MIPEQLAVIVSEFGIFRYPSNEGYFDGFHGLLESMPCERLPEALTEAMPNWDEAEPGIGESLRVRMGVRAAGFL